jgi:hypothetical protein
MELGAMHFNAFTGTAVTSTVFAVTTKPVTSMFPVVTLLMPGRAVTDEMAEATKLLEETEAFMLSAVCPVGIWSCPETLVEPAERTAVQPLIGVPADSEMTLHMAVLNEASSVGFSTRLEWETPLTVIATSSIGTSWVGQNNPATVVKTPFARVWAAPVVGVKTPFDEVMAPDII